MLHHTKYINVHKVIFYGFHTTHRHRDNLQTANEF